MIAVMKLLNGDEQTFELKDGTYLVGRSSKCDIIITQDGMSRKHCRIEVVNGEIFVTDLGSMNGVMIDGEKIRPNVRTEFKQYLTLSFGPVLSFKVENERENESITFMMAKPEKTSFYTRTLTKPMPTTGKLLNPNGGGAKKKEAELLRWKLVLLNTVALLLFFAVAYWYYKRDARPVKYEITPTKKTDPKEPVRDHF